MIRCITNVLVATVVLGAISVPCRAQHEMTKHELVGTWRLVSFKAITGSQISYPLGEHPGGVVGYTPSRFWLMLIDTDRKAPIAATLTDGEAASLMKSHIAYTGKYDADPAQTSDGIKIVVHVDSASNQAIIGTDRAWFARVDGNKLTVKSQAIFIPTSGLTSSVQLEYLKVD